nr:hypothetical protein [Vibrio sp. V07_P2A8T137]
MVFLLCVGFVIKVLCGK